MAVEAGNAAAKSYLAGNLEFYDFWETDLEEYTFRYLWCLYAIVWGITQYDKQKGGDR